MGFLWLFLIFVLIPVTIASVLDDYGKPWKGLLGRAWRFIRE